ncbi:hypothetical protein TNCV_557091 [Trichonephila clavipes]|uniref:Uncharacterized protein n=1 Tax=Trichonephila clavipes TaxID=2585209 RepID=A0A8X6RR37_TRICX|nr:hypothetical protein TNCV_557091 [Trichonephila clavipes]
MYAITGLPIAVFEQKNRLKVFLRRSPQIVGPPVDLDRRNAHPRVKEYYRKLMSLSPRRRAFFKYRTATAGSDVVQSGRPIFDDFFQHFWPYIGNNTANVVFQMVKRLWLIRIDQ